MRRIALALAVLASVLASPSPAAATPAPLPAYQVAGLQVALYRFGHYGGAIDGIEGPMTKTAIRAFQRSAGLEPDGVAGKQTRKALGQYGRPLFGVRTLRRGKVGFDVSVLQYLLAKNGFAPKRLNSNFGPVTEELVRKFQRKAGLPADGIVGKQTRAALLGEKVKAPEKAKAKTRTPASARLHHVVQPGETLTGIAERHGTTVSALARRNRIDPANLLLIGVRLVVPMAQMTTARIDVKASIAKWAAHYGVDPSLARALAWQESGFQSHVRSSAGAGGVMQVMPETWTFVELFVIGQNVPNTTDGNIRIGIAYLDHLLGQFNGNARLALGGYYQGPAAVKEHGLFAATKQFVANVFALRGRV